MAGISYADGVYGDREPERVMVVDRRYDEAPQPVENRYTPNRYKDYFWRESASVQCGEGYVFYAFHGLNAYSSQQYSREGNRYGGWGSQPSNVNVNVYNNGWYDPYWGYSSYWGYDPYWGYDSSGVITTVRTAVVGAGHSVGTRTMVRIGMAITAMHLITEGITILIGAMIHSGVGITILMVGIMGIILTIVGITTIIIRGIIIIRHEAATTAIEIETTVNTTADITAMVGVPS